MANVSGEITVKISFHDLIADDDSESSVLDAVFPNGWEGELDVIDMEVTVDDEDEEEEED